LFHEGWSGVLALMACALGVSSAHAQTANVAAAEALFRDGKARMAAKDYATACPKLADSYKLDPATGTLLALALCHERDGKVASAWGEYTDAVARSKREGRADREKAAQEKVVALEGKLSQLTIAVAPGVAATPGIEITRNSAPVGAGTLGTAVPVDPGSYAVEATAPRKKPWRGKVFVGASSDRQTLIIPLLEDDLVAALDPKSKKLPPMRPADKSAARPPAAVASSAPATAAPTPPADAGHHFGWIETTTIAAGVVGLGIGTAFMLQAIGKNEQSEAGCNGDICTPEGTQDRLDARKAGQIATIAFAAGGALVATGVAIYLIGGAQANAERSTASLQAAPLPVSGGLGGMLRGTF
jgi:hypothetical protein